MKLALSICLALALVGIGAVGCKKPDQYQDPAFMEKRQNQGTLAREMFQKSNGNFDALSAEDKKQLLDAFDGDETQVRQLFQQIANPTYGPTFTDPKTNPMQGGQ